VILGIVLLSGKQRRWPLWILLIDYSLTLIIFFADLYSAISHYSTALLEPLADKLAAISISIIVFVLLVSLVRPKSGMVNSEHGGQ